MTNRLRSPAAPLLGAIVGIALCAQNAAIRAAEVVDGASIYEQRCAACHQQASGRTPPTAVLREMTPESIVSAMTNGAMMLQASGMTREQMAAVAGFVSAKPFGSPEAAQTRPNPCVKPGAAVGAFAGKELPASDALSGQWNGWGSDLANTRFQPDPGLKASDLPRLRIKWAYAYAGRFAQGQPTIIGERIFVSNTQGEVSALDARSGCEHWTFNASASVKVALAVVAVRIDNVERQLAFFGDERANVYAVDVDSGALAWKTLIETHAVARIVGSPVFHEGRLYVPMSSAEESASRDEKYPCCTFRGSLTAMNAADGSVIWKAYPIVDEPKPRKISTAGTQTYGPAGAAIWSAPTVDAKRGLIYVATGNSYSQVPTDGSNAVVAFDMHTGARRWVNQVTPGDNFVIGCGGKNLGQGNCPDKTGPDHDFGAPPVLATLSNGKQIILAGQKSGMVYGMDPDRNGKLLWKKSAGHGSALGGIEWGLAVDGKQVYVAVSDASVREGGKPGLSAFDIRNGKERWHIPTPSIECSWGKEQCRRGQPGAVTAIPGIVFSGALDGHIRAYDTNSGEIAWDVDTSKSIAVVNGPDTAGGAIDAGGPTIANGMLFVNSGYGRWGKPGRLLLAFSIDGK